MTKIRTLLTAGIAVVILVAAAIVYALTSGGKSSAGDFGLTDPDGKAGPEIVSVTPNQEKLRAYDKLELTVDLKADYKNPFDPDELDLNAVFLSPQGKKWNINGFFDGKAWRIRLAPNEAGKWRYMVSVKDKTGITLGKEQSFETTAAAKDKHGWIEVSDKNKRFLQFDDGASFYGVGVAYPWNTTESGLDKIAANGGNFVTYWNGNYDGAGNGGGTQQLESMSSGLGKYGILKANRIDELVQQFDARNMHMNFVIWPHDSLADKINWPHTWDKNAYSLFGEAKEFYSNEKNWKYQENLYRYMIARWGYSPAIGIWNIITEINGTDGWELGDKDAANQWVAKVQNYFKNNDPYRHPTMGSMAGGAEDYWDEGYKTLDISDRENYYDLYFTAYAADIQKRWASYEKPLLTGETGNVTDTLIYHNAVWASLANGLASSPVWWDMGQVSDEMFGQMQQFSAFVKGIDFNESRTPIELAADTVKQQLEGEVSLEDAKDANDWAMPNWADANKDPNQLVYSVKADGDAITANMSFATGSFSQGFIQQAFQKAGDWSGYKELQVDLFVDQDGGHPLKARPVFLPNWKWTEGDNASDVALVPGQWVTLKVPLLNAPQGYWRDSKVITEENLKGMTAWGVKVWAGASDKGSKPVTVKIRSPRLVTDTPPVVDVKDSQGWVMKGDQTSYGWLVTEQGNIDGKTAEIKGFGTGKAVVSWYNTWDGKTIGETTVEAQGDSLKLTAPNVGRPDVAFIIKKIQ